MEDWKLGAVESRFADLIWDNAPLPSRELVSLAEQTLNWKKSTTYTVLRKLCERGIFVNSDGMVDARISRDGFYARQSEAVVEESFQGSLPAFIAAFTSRRALSKQEISELRKMIENFEEE